MEKPVAQWTFTDSELLALVRQAKAGIFADGQEYEAWNLVWRGASLAALSAEEDRLQRRIDAAVSAASGRGSAHTLLRFRRS